MSVVEYQASPPYPKWSVTMPAARVSALSGGKVRCAVSADAGGLPYNPSNAVVEFAFIPSYTNPGSGDWHAGDWDVSVIGQYVAEINPGVGGLGLGIGTYYVWVRITDVAAGETPVINCGELIVQ